MTSQSARNFAVLAAIHTKYLSSNSSSISVNTLPAKDYAIVVFAPILAGSIIFAAIFVTCAVCRVMREKRKRIEEATSLHNLPWIQFLEVYNIQHGQDATTGFFLPPPSQVPPPAYNKIVETGFEKSDLGAKEDVATVENEIINDNGERRNKTQDGLPTYEAALRMDGTP